MKVLYKDIDKIKNEHILFFDMDGTLIDTNRANILAYLAAIEAVTGSRPDFDMKQEIRLTRSSLYTILPNLDALEYKKIINEKENLYFSYLKETKIIPATINILKTYSKTNRTVLVTNCRKKRALETLTYHGINNLFSDFCFRSEENNSSNKVNKYQNALMQIGAFPKQIIVFENDVNEIEDALKTGIKNINPII